MEVMTKGRTKDGIEFTELVEINTLELTKLPVEADQSELWYWLRFIESDDEGELEMIAERNPQMKKAVGVLKELSADERTRMLAEAREKARRDAASRLNWAREEGIQIGEQRGEEKIIKLLKSGKSPEEIIREYNSH